MSGSGSPQARQMKVITCALVQVSLGENVVELVPVVMPWATAHATDSAYQLSDKTSEKDEALIAKAIEDAVPIIKYNATSIPAQGFIEFIMISPKDLWMIYC